MLRLHCVTESGQHVIVLVLEPSNIERMRAGEPIQLDLQPYSGGLLTQPLQLVIDAPKDAAAFDAVVQAVTRQATEDGAKINIVPKPAGGVQ